VQINRSIILRTAVLLSLMVNLTLLSSKIQADTGNCGGAIVTLPFTDVMGNPFFCQIAAAYFSGLTAGTSATTYSPGANVNREQMAAFTTRTLDQSLKRGNRKAVTKKWWTPQNANSLALTDVDAVPRAVEFDGTDLWVAHQDSGIVMRVRPGDGKVLDSWTGATFAKSIVTAMGKVFITGGADPGSLYMIDPTQPAGAVTTLTNSLGHTPNAIAFDGSRIWTANEGSVSIVTLNPLTVTTVTTGFSRLYGMLYDGSNIWVTDLFNHTLLKLNADGSIAQTLGMGLAPRNLVFDGINIWVANFTSSTIAVVRVKDSQGNPLSSAFQLAVLTGNGLNQPTTIAFDGERMLVTNVSDIVSLWKATDLTPLGAFPTGANTTPFGACSDGLNFWITLSNTSKLARF
jgi:hypothetical protein